MTLWVLLTMGVGWVVQQAAGGIVESGGEQAFSAALRSLRERLWALAGTPHGADLARGVRRVQLRALRTLVRDYEQVSRGSWLSRFQEREPFFRQVEEFCDRAASLDAASALQAAVQSGGLELHDGDASGWGILIEKAVLNELEQGLAGLGFPPGFSEHFHEGGGGRPSFLELFAVFFAEEIKSNQAFSSILNSTLLLQSAARLGSVAELIAALETRFSHVLSRVDADVAEANRRLVRIEEEQARMLEVITAEKTVPLLFLRAILARLGEEHIPDEKIAAVLEEKADELLDLRRRHATDATEASDVEAVFREALMLLGDGQLLAARQQFVAARSEIRKLRHKSSLEEASLLAGEAAVDRIELRYLAAADRYAAAEALVTDVDPAMRLRYLWLRAATLQQHGDEFGDSGVLAEAVSLWRQALALCRRGEDSLRWAECQHNLGTALRILGARDRDTANLKEALAAYECALEERTRERVPSAWASTQHAMGITLRTLGSREANPKRIEEAVRAFEAALLERPRGSMPAQWASTQMSMANALRELGEHGGGTSRLEAAVDAYRNALEVYSPVRDLAGWARAQVNLSKGLRILGERESSIERLYEAAEACRNALRSTALTRSPTLWAMIQESLGIALRALGERDDLSPSRLSGELQEQSTAGEQALGVLSPQEVVLTAAVDAFRAALTVYSRESDAVAWALTHNNLGCALRARGERDGGVEMLEEAVDSFNFALEVYDRAVMPLRWAIVTSNLGNSLRLLGERSGNPELLNRAVAAQRAALEIRTREKFPMDWAVTQTNLGDALVARGIHAGDAYSLREAVDAYACAIGVFAAASADLWADLARHGRERALGALRERGTS